MNALARITSFRRGAAVALGLTVLAGATLAQAPEPVATGSLDEVTATVAALDAATRTVTLKTEDGRDVTLQAGEEVRNFDQIKVGDRVTATFYEAIAAEVTEAPPGAEPAIITTERAPIGGRPRGAVGLLYTVVVTIDSVDTDTHTVKFTGPNGPDEVEVLRPELQEFVAGLKQGDRVELTYGEAFAIELTPVNQ